MITGPESAKQIERLGGLDFYPHNDKPALRELRVAGESAHSEATLREVVDEWLADQVRCPKPAELRRLIHGLHTAFVKAKCKTCDGSLWITVWKLITYHPGEYRIKKAELLDLDLEQMDALRKKLGPSQDILSAAKPCSCMPNDHKYLTGERE